MFDIVTCLWRVIACKKSANLAVFIPLLHYVELCFIIHLAKGEMVIPNYVEAFEL